MAEMTMRARMLAVVEGREHDRVPFVQYSGIVAPDDEVWSVIGRGKMGVLGWTQIHRFEHPNCRYEWEEISQGRLRGTRATLHTPAGSLTEERLNQPTYGVGAIRKHFVKEPEDYAVLRAYLQDLVVLDNLEEIERGNQAFGEDGFCHVSVPRTPYHQLWIEWVSIEDLGLHLADSVEALDDCIELLADVERRTFELVPKAPIPYVVIPDNLTAPVIGERYFRRYCLPLYQELAGIAAEAGIPVYAHLDGDLKPLWGAIGESGLRGIDSLSPPPDNDTSVAQVASMWPEMRMGVNFPSSVHLSEPETIYRRAMEILEEGGRTGRLQIQISENVPPEVWRKSYPEIVRAIDDWGGPQG